MVAIKYLSAAALLAISVLAQGDGKGNNGANPFEGKGKFGGGKDGGQNGGAAGAGQQAGQQNNNQGQQNQDQNQNQDQQNQDQNAKNNGQQGQDQNAKDNQGKDAKAGNQGGAAGAGADAAQQNNNQGQQNQDQNNNQGQQNQDQNQGKNNADQNQGKNNADQNGKNNNAGGAANADLALDPALVQTASQATGQEQDADPDQANSLQSDNNFINFCQGKQLTNGKQNNGGSCNGIVMGDIPAKNNMVSAIIINPALGDVIDEETTFDIQVQVQNLVAGSFTNPDITYYAAPQQLQGGKIVGHSHVSVQDLGGNLNPNQPPNPQVFAFFKGINDDGNGQGLLSATVEGGLPAGNYRVCTINSASNHQPVVMPVAQRGVQDDCTKFVVGKANAGDNNNAGQAGQDQNNQGKNNGQQNNNQGQQNQDQQNQDQNQGKNNGQDAKGKGKRRWSRITRRAFVA